MSKKIGSFFSKGPAVDMRCAKCGKHSKCNHPFVKPVGKGNLGILIIVDSPDESSDSKCNFTESTAYKFLTSELKKHRINIYQDCWVIPAVRCFSEGKVDRGHALTCRHLFEEDMEKLKPSFVWTFGNAALGLITQPMYAGITDTMCMGDNIPLVDFGSWLVPFPATFMVQKNKKDANFQSVFTRTVKSAMELVKKNPKVPVLDWADPQYIEFLTDKEEILNLFDNWYSSILATDIESTGLKPHRNCHEITSLGVSDGRKGWAIPICHNEFFWDEEDYDEIVDSFYNLCKRKDVCTIAHNKPFENMWYDVLWDITSAMNVCTMIDQHVLDHREGTKGLKYQVFRRYGIYGYEKNTEKYIEAPYANDMNKMMEMPLDQQLLYVGQDAFFTAKLFLDQQVELKKGRLKEASNFFQKSANDMYLIQCTGAAGDVDYFQQQEKELTEKINSLEKKLHEYEDVAAFEKKYRKTFSHTTDDLKKLLFDEMKVDSEKTTDSGAKSVDADALKEMDIPFCNDILAIRKYLKLRDTYLAQFQREIVNGIMHPFFKLYSVSTYRSSSSDPNDQNIPKRDEESKKIIRRGLKPRKGRLLAEIDFSGMEVSTSATYHKDPKFIEYLVTPGTDMHRDNACDIWMLKPEQVSGIIRFFVKNGWTFPQFYGDYYGSCAEGLWKSSLQEETTDGIILEDHLYDMGITCLSDFTEHCKTAEDIMWNKRFKVYSQWKKDINDFYLKNGYVETHLGFRFTGILDRKQTANFPVQGTAFHLLLTCLHILMQRKRKYKWKSDIIGQVHDSGKMDLIPEETVEILQNFRQIAEEELPAIYPWINVPFSVDAEISDIDGSFADLKEVDIATLTDDMVFNWKDIEG